MAIRYRKKKNCINVSFQTFNAFISKEVGVFFFGEKRWIDIFFQPEYIRKALTEKKNEASEWNVNVIDYLR